ncbi:MAG: FAD-dependent monooxygenase [Egibacteraceae bacterium]
MSPTAPSPVLIAGGGPVGITAALLLARFDVPSVVLEAEPTHAPVGSKAICMQRDALDVLDRVGCAEPLVAEGVTWTLGRTYYRETELLQITFPDPGLSAFPPFVNVPQSSTERHLWERAVNAPSVDLRTGHRVVGVTQHDAGVTVRVERADGTADVAGSHLLACDGARSTVRKLLGLAFEGHSYDEEFLIADIRADLGFAAERRFFFDPAWNPGRQVLVHPQPDSVWRIDWQVPGDFDLARERGSGALDDRVRAIVGDRPYEIVWLSAYRFHQRLAPTFRVGRVLLAGDAAHLMSPFGARGLNSGIQDAENAAWKLAFVVRGWAGDALLASYDAERRAAAEENLRVTGETMRFLVPRNAEEAARRKAILEQALTDPAARRSVDSGRLAEPFSYLDSPLTTPWGDPGAFPRDPGVARPVVPGVLCPDGPCTVQARPDVSRLRQLFGSALVVLATTTADALRLEMACRAAVRAPVDVHALEEIDRLGVLAPALHAGPRTAYVVRPDGHLAARVDGPDPDALARALRRAVTDAGPPPGE